MPEAGKNISSIDFELEFWKKAATKTKSLPEAGNINFSIRLLIGKKQPPKPRSCRNLEETIVQYFLQ